MILDNKIIVTFDAELLFTNVAINATIEATLQKLENDPNLAGHTTLTPVQIANHRRTSWGGGHGGLQPLQFPKSVKFFGENAHDSGNKKASGLVGYFF